MTATSAPRIAPGSRQDVGLVGWGISRISARVSGTEVPNLFLTLGRHRPLFRGWLHFAGRMMPGGKLPRRETEAAIIRVAHLRNCRYEVDHHVHLGRRAGLTAHEIERLQAPAIGDDGWSPREHALLLAVDALHHRQDLTDDEWERLRAHLDEREAIELLLLAGHYEMLATTIAALRIQPDRRRG